MKNPLRSLAAGLALAALATLPALAAPDAPQRGSTAAVKAEATQAAALAGVTTYLSLWTQAPMAVDSTFADTMVLRYVHAHPELTSEVRGRASIVTQVRSVAKLGTSWSFSKLRVFPTSHDNIYYAQFTASGKSADGASAIEQEVVISLEMKGLKVSRLVEFSNPAIRLAIATP